MEDEAPQEEKVRSFFTAFSKILATKIPENQPPVLFKYKTPEKKIAEEIKRKKELRHKKVQKLQEKKKNYENDTNVVLEKGLRRVALKGVIKIFNEVASAQLERKTKKIKEGARKQSERFGRRMKRIPEDSEARKIVNYNT